MYITLIIALGSNARSLISKVVNLVRSYCKKAEEKAQEKVGNLKMQGKQRRLVSKSCRSEVYIDDAVYFRCLTDESWLMVLSLTAHEILDRQLWRKFMNFCFLRNVIHSKRPSVIIMMCTSCHSILSGHTVRLQRHHYMIIFIFIIISDILLTNFYVAVTGNRLFSCFYHEWG